MRLLKVCIDKINIYVDLNDGIYLLRVYNDGLEFDQRYKCLNKLNRKLKEFGFNFRVSEDHKKCEFDVVCNEEDQRTIKFTYYGKTIYSTISPKIATETESDVALDLAIKIWESVHGGKVNKRLVINTWKEFIDFKIS